MATQHAAMSTWKYRAWTAGRSRASTVIAIAFPLMEVVAAGRSRIEDRRRNRHFMAKIGSAVWPTNGNTAPHDEGRRHVWSWPIASARAEAAIRSLSEPQPTWRDLMPVSSRSNMTQGGHLGRTAAIRLTGLRWHFNLNL